MFSIKILNLKWSKVLCSSRPYTYVNTLQSRMPSWQLLCLDQFVSLPWKGTVKNNWHQENKHNIPFNFFPTTFNIYVFFLLKCFPMIIIARKIYEEKHEHECSVQFNIPCTLSFIYICALGAMGVGGGSLNFG